MARDLFPTTHVLAPLPGKDSRKGAQPVFPADAPLRWHGTRKNLESRPSRRPLSAVRRMELSGRDRQHAAVFLDRDGTINEEVGYLDRLEKLRLIPGAAEAVRLINRSGMKAVVVTNQSGVARGLFDEAFLGAVHLRLREMLRAEGAVLDGLYYCPHHPREGRGIYLRQCDCRKPAPRLLLNAVAELSLDPKRSLMIGDTLRDVEAAARIGVPAILVRTGYGAEAAAALESGTAGLPAKAGVTAPPREEGTRVPPAHIAPDLLAAVRWLLRNRTT